MSDYTKGKLRVVEDANMIRIDCPDGLGLPFADIYDLNCQANAEHIVKLWNLNEEYNLEKVCEVVGALEEVRKIIAEGAKEGFVPTDGDWAERLFHSQQATSKALQNIKREQS